jgi:hypothetical protein
MATYLAAFANPSHARREQKRLKNARFRVTAALPASTENPITSAPERLTGDDTGVL